MMELYLELFLSFVRIGFCSFGGTTMVPVINDEVLSHGWMTAAEVIDIVAVAEMTPGSLGINCATFVGLRTAGIPGALSASFGVMMPSLTTLSTGCCRSYLPIINGNPWLESALRGVRPVSLGMLAAAASSAWNNNFTGGKREACGFLPFIGIR
ncbi:MAG: chromate transporter [Clostridium sp.]